jgi:hypothetical protein
MAEKPRKKDKSTTKEEKKQAETVHLTPEELRAISGGVTVTGLKQPPLTWDPSIKKAGTP